MSEKKNVCEILGLNPKECDYLFAVIEGEIEKIEEAIGEAKKKGDRKEVRGLRVILATWLTIQRKLFPDVIE